MSESDDKKIEDLAKKIIGLINNADVHLNTALATIDIVIMNILAHDADLKVSDIRIAYDSNWLETLIENVIEMRKIHAHAREHITGVGG